MRVIVVRHGETYGTMRRIVESRAHGRLTDAGKDQAQDAAKLLRDETIDVIYSSNLQRAFDTALIIAEYHASAPLIQAHELRERDHGDYEGAHYETVPYLDYEGASVHVPMPGGESWHDVERRVGVFLNTLYAEHPSATVLLVGHGGTTKAVRSLLGGMPLEESIGIRVPSASVHYFAMNAPTRMGSEEGAL